jgi:hypothetical protein
MAKRLREATAGAGAQRTRFIPTAALAAVGRLRKKMVRLLALLAQDERPKQPEDKSWQWQCRAAAAAARTRRPS